MRPIIHEPYPCRINLLHAHPRNRRLRPERGEQRRNRAEAVVTLILVLAFCWWLGGKVYTAVVTGSRPFVAVADAITKGVSGR